MLIDNAGLWIVRHACGPESMRHIDDDAVRQPLLGDPWLQDWLGKTGACKDIAGEMSDPDNGSTLIIVDTPVLLSQVARRAGRLCRTD